MNHIVIFALFAGVVASPDALAQRGKKPARPPHKEKWRIDPFTKMEPAAMKKAGYLSFGPFPWGDDHSSENIEQKLGKIPLIWLETAHFRIGSTLGPWTLETKNKKQMRRLREELRRLETRIPRFKAKRTRKLGSWLRLHLYAQRLEELHADISGRLARGLGKKASRENPRDATAGERPGLPEKSLVLLFQRRTSLERYLAVFLNMGTKFPRRYIFPKSNRPLFVTAADVQPGNLWNDIAMHCHVVFNLVHNFVDGYKGHHYALPVWWGEGLAHWYSRRLDDSFSNYSQPPKVEADMREREKWNKLVRGLVKHDNFTPAEQMIRWLEFERIRFKDHLTAWSRVDYLMQLNDTGFGVFLDRIKGLRDSRGATIRGTAILDYQRKAFEEAWSLTPGELDEKWKAWVLATYPAK